MNQVSHPSESTTDVRLDLFNGMPPDYFGAILYRKPAMRAKTMFGSHRAIDGGSVSV